MSWGREYGWRPDNPAMGMKLIPKPKGEADQNRDWRDHEIAALFNHAPPQLRLPIAISICTGMRQADALALSWSSYDGERIRWTAGKNKVPCVAPVGESLKRLLDAQDRVAVQICVDTKGRPWRQANYRVSFFKAVRRLQAAGLIGEGATFHGFRHTVGTFARNSGESDFRVSAALGDRSTEMAKIYGRNANRQEAQMAVLAAVQERFGNLLMETKMETNPQQSTKWTKKS